MCKFIQGKGNLKTKQKKEQNTYITFRRSLILFQISKAIFYLLEAVRFFEGEGWSNYLQKSQNLYFPEDQRLLGSVVLNILSFEQTDRTTYEQTSFYLVMQTTEKLMIKNNSLEFNLIYILNQLEDLDHEKKMKQLV